MLTPALPMTWEWLGYLLHVASILWPWASVTREILTQRHDLVNYSGLDDFMIWYIGRGNSIWRHLAQILEGFHRVVARFVSLLDETNWNNSSCVFPGSGSILRSHSWNGVSERCEASMASLPMAIHGSWASWIIWIWRTGEPWIPNQQISVIFSTLFSLFSLGTCTDDLICEVQNRSWESSRPTDGADNEASTLSFLQSAGALCHRQRHRASMLDSAMTSRTRAKSKKKPGLSQQSIWGFPKNGGTPKSSILIGFSIIKPYKPTIYWGTPLMDTPLSLLVHFAFRTDVQRQDVPKSDKFLWNLQPVVDWWGFFTGKDCFCRVWESAILCINRCVCCSST